MCIKNIDSNRVIEMEMMEDAHEYGIDKEVQNKEDIEHGICTALSVFVWILIFLC